MSNLIELQLPKNIDVDISTLKYLKNLSVITLDENHIPQVEDILLLNLPNLKEIQIGVTSFSSFSNVDLIEKLKNKTMIKIESFDNEYVPEIPI